MYFFLITGVHERRSSNGSFDFLIKLILYRNPQTTVFCEKLGICDLNLMLCEQRPSAVEVPYYCEMKLREQESAEAHKAAIDSADGVVVVTNNPDEIDIGLEEEADDVSSHPVELSVCDTSSLQAQEVVRIFLYFYYFLDASVFLLYFFLFLCKTLLVFFLNIDTLGVLKHIFMLKRVNYNCFFKLVDADNNFFVVDPMPQRSPVHHRRGQH